MLVLPLSLQAQSTAPLADSATADRGRAIACMATAIAYEAAFEPVEGKQAVAEVILNRVRAAGYPKSVCGVVFAGSERPTGCQFSFTCDGSLARRMSAGVMTIAETVALAALEGRNPLRVAGSTHYHADYVTPYWAASLVRVNKIGAHIFYRAPMMQEQGARALPFTPNGEPFVAALGQRPDAIAALPSITPPTKSAARAFMPWGLTPLPVPH